MAKNRCPMCGNNRFKRTKWLHNDIEYLLDVSERFDLMCCWQYRVSWMENGHKYYCLMFYDYRQHVWASSGVQIATGRFTETIMNDCEPAEVPKFLKSKGYPV